MFEVFNVATENTFEGGFETRAEAEDFAYAENSERRLYIFAVRESAK